MVPWFKLSFNTTPVSRFQPLSELESLKFYAKVSPEAGSSVYNHSEEWTEDILTEFMADKFRLVVIFLGSSLVANL